MARIEDIRQGQEDFLVWDQFDGKEPKEALPAIYNHAVHFSNKCREWYWKSIRNKRRVSVGARGTTFLLGSFGIAAPLSAVIWSSTEYRLLWSQLAVVALAVGGLITLADRIFGWSSGWLRYISTVTAMENLTRQFQMDWANYCVNLQRPVGPSEVRPLFEIAQRFQIQLGELQSKETDNWIAEFNSGRDMLGDVLKSTREAANKTAVEAQNAILALSQGGTPGAIELTVTATREPAPSLRVALDGGHAEVCNGLTWARLQVEPGHHQIVVQACQGEVVVSEVTKVVEIPAGGVARLTMQI